MKILVSIKRVVDYNVRVQIKSDGSGIETDGIKMSMNPFDEIAVEEAIRIKEAGQAQEIIVASIGSDASQEQLRSALAMGADAAILIKTDDAIQPLTAAKALAALVAKEKPDLVLMGKQAIDDDACQTPQMLAALLDWPQATFASHIVIADGKVEVIREVDAGLETVSVDLPAVISTDLRLNEPRYIKIPQIMKAKTKPLHSFSLDDLGITPAPALKLLNTSLPPPRQPGIKVNNVADLVEALK
ncbi:MAG: electron transfer flavoprotein subunit beta/FixA family protein, partial [Methylobacter sp.]